MALFPRLTRSILVALLALAAAFSFTAPVLAQEASASGEVRRVDAAGGKVTLKHGPIADLQLPAMTLVYHAESTLLQGLQPGDQVKFSAKRQDDRYVVTKISK